MINVLLVDDHTLVRTGIRRLLSDFVDIHVYAECESGEEAIAAVRDFMPDIVLMDVSMPGMGGLEATQRLVKSFPDIKIIILTAQVSEPFPSQLLKAGAVGYLTKGCSETEMASAIRRAHNGKHYICQDVAQSMALSQLPGKASPLHGLSRRELQVMLLLVQGYKIADISEQLSVSPKTISTYRYRLLGKLGVKTDAELTRLGINYGLLDQAL